MVKRITIISIILCAAALYVSCSANADENEQGAGINIHNSTADETSNDVKLEVITDSLNDGLYTQFLLISGDREVYFDGRLALNRAGSEEVIVADLTGDNIPDIAVMFVWGYGTGVSVPEIYIFDGVTLEKYEVKDAVEIATEQIKSTADDDYFYVAYENDTLVINKSELDILFENLFPTAGWGSIYNYAIYNGELYAYMAPQISAAGFYGTIIIKYEFNANRFDYNSIELYDEIILDFLSLKEYLQSR